MYRKGFDINKYIEMQSLHIQERISYFGGRLYLEFGGKLFDDYHASRVLPGFEPDTKIRMLEKLRDQVEVIVVLNANDVEENKIRGDSNLPYKEEALRQIDAIKALGFFVSSIVLTMYTNQPNAVDFESKLFALKIPVYRHYGIENYPNNTELTISEEGFGKNEFVPVQRELIVVTAPGPGSGKMAVCLSQIYQEQQHGNKAGYAKWETFPIWNLPLEHPVNIAYEAATVDLRDRNMMDYFHEAAYHVPAVSYNRDLATFPVVEMMLSKMYGASPYKSPTDMGVNMVGNCILDEDAVCYASKQEIIRRYYSEMCKHVKAPHKQDFSKSVELLMQKVGVTTADRKVVQAALDREERANNGQPAAALELPDGTIVTGKTSDLLGASSAVLLNALKKLAGLPQDVKVISYSVIDAVSDLKVNHLGNHNPRLHTDEVLIALSICAAQDQNAELCMQALEKLKGSEVHSTVMLSETDEKTFKNLGCNVTCEPKYQTQKLFRQ